MSFISRRRTYAPPGFGPGVFGLTPKGKLTSGVQSAGTVTAADPFPTGDVQGQAGDHAQEWELVIVTAGTIQFISTGAGGWDLAKANGTVVLGNFLAGTTTQSISPAGIYYWVYRDHPAPSAYTIKASNVGGVMG